MLKKQRHVQQLYDNNACQAFGLRQLNEILRLFKHGYTRVCMLIPLFGDNFQQRFIEYLQEKNLLLFI